MLSGEIGARELALIFLIEYSRASLDTCRLKSCCRKGWRVNDPQSQVITALSAVPSLLLLSPLLIAAPSLPPLPPSTAAGCIMLDSFISLPALCSSSASPSLNVAPQQSAVIVLTSAACGSEKLLGAVLAGDAATVREMIKENSSLDITSEPLGNWLLVLLAVCSWQLSFADAFHPLLFTLFSSPFRGLSRWLCAAGSECLHIAAKNGHANVITLLMAHGCSRDTPDQQARTRAAHTM